jgi:hypothetical protein
MNAISFVAISILLAFVTGFVVAGIIWFISWAILPKKETTSISNFLKNFNAYYKPNLSTAKVEAKNTSDISQEYTNKELYKFYHGKN